MAVFGKAMGNGYAITAIAGRREVMEAAQTTFISSTFWTERIVSAAALKTLDVMEAQRAWEEITATGKKIKNQWIDLGQRHGFEVEVSGLDALAGFQIKDVDWLAAKTFITQEMLKRGYLAAASIYVCTEHSEKVIEGYFEEMDEVMRSYRSHLNAGHDPSLYLDGPPCHSKFQRLN